MRNCRTSDALACPIACSPPLLSSLCCSLAHTDLAETCRRHNVGLLAYSPLAGGSLTGKYNRDHVDPKARLNLFPG
jgi:aryl-alcohol dehydrogenase-like predicted oxidoreductase